MQLFNDFLLSFNVSSELVETFAVEFGGDSVVGLHQPRLLRRRKTKLDYPTELYYEDIRTLSISQTHRDVYKTTPEMRTPPLIRTLEAVPRVSGIEEFHCTYKFGNTCTSKFGDCETNHHFS